MKKAYNLDWIKNLNTQEAAETWFNKKLITEDQLSSVRTNFPESFYQPGIFVKIGLFIFTIFACSFSGGFLSLFFVEASGDGGLAFMSVIASVAFIFILEYLIRERKLYHSGVDNALLYSALGAVMLPFFLLAKIPSIWQSGSYVLIFLVLALLRYADVFVAVGVFVTLFTVLANLMMKFTLGAALLPFALMAASALIFFLSNGNKSDYYATCAKVFKVLSLITFYAGGNYFTVREGNALLNDLPGLVSPQIAFSQLFYFFTFIIPLLYIFFGLRKKDRILLITGLFAVGFSVFTYRYYFTVLPVEQAILLAGILLIALAVSVIKYLKTPKLGLTDEPDGKRKLANLEALIIAQQIGQTPQEKGVEFGEGNFGGAGAGSSY